MKYNFVIFRSKVMSGRQRTHLWLRYVREEWIYIFDSCGCCEGCKRGKGIYNFFFFVIRIVIFEFERLETCAAFFSLFFCVTVIHDSSTQLQGAGHYPSSRGCSNS